LIEFGIKAAVIVNKYTLASIIVYQQLLVPIWECGW